MLILRIQKVGRTSSPFLASLAAQDWRLGQWHGRRSITAGYAVFKELRAIRPIHNRAQGSPGSDQPEAYWD